MPGLPFTGLSRNQPSNEYSNREKFMSVYFLPIPVERRYAVIREDDSACQLTVPGSSQRELFYYLPANRSHVIKTAASHAKVYGHTYKTLREACFQAELFQLLEG